MKPGDGLGGRIGSALVPTAAVVGAGRPAAAQPERYVLDVRLDPDRGSLSASVRVSVRLAEGASAIAFDLHETFRIIDCTIDGQPARCARVDPPPSGGEATSRGVSAGLPSRARREVVQLEVRYEGTLWSLPNWGQPDAQGPFMDDALGPDRVELALYSAWYPSFGFGPTFDVDMDLAIPRGWGVACIGLERDRRESPTGTTARWEARSVNDVVVVASPRLRSKAIETSAGRVLIHHTRLPEALLTREGRQTEQTLRLFTSILGESSGGRTVQLLAVRSIEGEDEFRKILDREWTDVRGLPADAPALAWVPFGNDGPGYTVRYHKGALMLDAFRRRLGDDAFLRACQGFYEKTEGRSVGTPEFRAHWRESLGDEELLSAWLDSPGSAPAPPP